MSGMRTSMTVVELRKGPNRIRHVATYTAPGALTGAQAQDWVAEMGARHRTGEHWVFTCKRTVVSKSHRLIVAVLEVR